MAQKQFPIDDVLGALAETPSRLASAVAGVPAPVLAAPLTQGEWSGVEILAHLRACADLWGANALAMVEHRDAEIRTTDPDDWPERQRYERLTWSQSLGALARQRRGLVATLAGIGRDEWTRTIIVLTWGQQYPRNILFYAQRLAVHERSHARHLERLFLGKARRP